jgi:recombination protein RecR
LRKPKEFSRDLSESIFDFKNEIKYCIQCHNISDKDLCDICSNKSRDQSIVCVVEDIRDVIAIENTNLYNGLYHVLGGVISPIEGIGPEDLNVLSLEEKITDKKVDEIIFALSATIEADTTSFYLFKILKKHNVKVSVLARGIPVGDQLEYTDEVTLARSIQNRRPYETNLSN